MFSSGMRISHAIVIYCGFSICVFFIRILFDNYFVCVGSVGCYEDCATCGTYGSDDDCFTCVSGLELRVIYDDDGTGKCEQEFDAIDNCKKYWVTLPIKCKECITGYEPNQDGSSCEVQILEMLVISGAHSMGCFALLRGIFVSIFMCSGYVCLGWAPCVFLICCLGAHQRTQVKRSDSWIRAMSMLNGRRCFGLCLIHVQKC